jgi:hypothetical protein
MKWRPVAVVVAAWATVTGCGATAASHPVVTVGGVGHLPGTTPGGPGAISGPATGGIESPAASADRYVAVAGAPAYLTDPRLLLVGDSVLVGTTLGSPDALDRYLGTLGWHMWVDAAVGRFLSQADTVMAGFRAAPAPWSRRDAGETPGADPVFPQTAVLMLGNNYNGDAVKFRAELDQALSILAPARRIIMFTVPLWRPEQAQVNDELRAAAARDTRLTLIDWERQTREIPGLLYGDHIHPNPLGAMYLVQEIARVLGPAPGAPSEAVVAELGVPSTGPLPNWVAPKARETIAEGTPGVVPWTATGPSGPSGPSGGASGSGLAGTSGLEPVTVGSSAPASSGVG